MTEYPRGWNMLIEVGGIIIVSHRATRCRDYLNTLQGWFEDILESGLTDVTVLVVHKGKTLKFRIGDMKQLTTEGRQ